MPSRHVNSAVRGAKRPLRIMHIVSGYAYGGMEIGVSKIVNGLDRSLFASSVCSTKRVAADRPPLRPDVPFHALNRQPGNDPRFVVELVRLIRRERPDVVHTHAWGTLCEGLLAAKLARVRTVVHGEHGTMELKPYNLRVQRVAWHLVTQVLSVSSRLAGQLATVVRFPRERIEVIRNGVDVARFSLSARAAARASLKLSETDITVGTVGRLHPVKDHRNLIEAADILNHAGVPAVTLIAGEGAERGTLEAEIRARDLTSRVRLIGHRSDVERVFSALDIFVLPSRSEGLSNTILEAMAAGLPVVATNVGGADELVTDGLTGLLVPRADSTALANALGALATDPSRRGVMGRAARDRAVHEFSVDRMVTQYGNLYSRLAGYWTVAEKREA